MAAAAAKEKKLKQQLEHQQKGMDGGINDASADAVVERKVDLAIRQQKELEEKENAMLAVAGIKIPKKNRHRNHSQSLKLNSGQLEEILQSKVEN